MALTRTGRARDAIGSIVTFGWIVTIGSILATAGATRAAAQGEPQTRSAHTARSAPIADVRYDVTVDTATTRKRLLAVAMHFKVGGPGPVVLALPAWSPGHYVLLWFARRVSSFTPTMNGAPLAWRQLDFETWELDGTTPGAAVSIDFNYQADTIDRAVAWTRPDFGFFNGTNVFMYPVGRGFDWPAQVTIHTDSGWNIATGMTESRARATGATHPDAGIARTFTASNYHDLVDMPFFIGHFDFDSTQVSSTAGGPKDRWVRAVNYPAGLVTGERMTRMLGWLAKLAVTHAAVFHDMPWKTYTVLQIADPHPNGGGLEHQDSQVDEITPRALDATNLSGLYSHEMFHSWNVKRLRPADMVPYRYDDAQPTGWLWVSEGITDYYADLDVLRSGIGDSVQFFNATAQKISIVTSAPPHALADASLRAWIAPLDGSNGLYYPKGSLAGLMLDILIRDASDNHRSLDDVMRTLYTTTYKQGRGFTADEWWGAVAAAARPGTPAVAFAEVRRRYIEARDPYPWTAILPLAGLRVTADSTTIVQIGIATAADSSGGLRVSFVAPMSSAATAGILPGDHLDQLGDIAVHGDSSVVSFRHRYATATSTVPVMLTRAGQQMTVQLPIQTRLEITSRIDATSDASAKAIRVRHGLLTGTTERGGQ
jgi:predicted metalloprotease with PDZ domain